MTAGSSQVVKVEGEAELTAALLALAREEPKIARSVLSRTAKRAATRSRREMAKRLGIPVKPLRRRMGSYPHRDRSRLTMYLWVGLKHAIKSSELSSRLNARLARNARNPPFRAKMPSGHEGMFYRHPTRKRRHRIVGPEFREDGQRTWLPIVEAVIEIPKTLARETMYAAGREQLTTYFPAEFGRRLARAVEKRRTRK